LNGALPVLGYADRRPVSVQAPIKGDVGERLFPDLSRRVIGLFPTQTFGFFFCFFIFFILIFSGGLVSGFLIL
jgi:hypothetical protein